MSRVRIIDEASNPLSEADEPVNADVADPVHRFSEMASFRHWCQYSFAVSRRTAMEQTRLLLPFWSSDRLYCAELALAGPLVREPEALFRIRQHENRVTKRAGRNDWEVIRFYLTPGGSRAVTLHYAGRLREAVQRSALSPADKRRAYAALAGWGVENAGKLTRSLGRATLEALTRPYAESKRHAAEEAKLSG